jgi:DNA modification methylase
VLKGDGTLWLVLGDSYGGISAIRPLKRKDLVGIPWQIAFALRADGWYLRTDIVWNKPNPMPENVRDRPTRSHEYIFLLSKQSRYYYDRETIAEPLAPSTLQRIASHTVRPGQNAQVYSDAERRTVVNLKGRKMPSNWKPLLKTFGGDIGSPSQYRRNARSVWTLPTRPYNGAHFATFPPDLIRPCIRAGCPVGGTVLDPFMGAGTTGLVAAQLVRNTCLFRGADCIFLSAYLPCVKGVTMPPNSPSGGISFLPGIVFPL